jgi:hypothetical protein
VTFKDLKKRARLYKKFYTNATIATTAATTKACEALTKHMQMLGPNNEVPSRIKIKYSSPRPKSAAELAAIREQQRAQPSKKSSSSAFGAAVRAQSS